MLLVIDNYDSFTYNLVQYLGELGATLTVRRNDEVTVGDIEGMKPDRILISPGPGRPEGAGVTVEMIQSLADSFPMLGVCLGHQAIAYAFGAEIVAAPKLLHGKCSEVTHDGQGVFAGHDSPFSAGRYHSLVVSKQSWPDCLEMTATTVDDATVMGLRHRTKNVHGVQFHPESILTTVGHHLLKNFLEQ